MPIADERHGLRPCERGPLPVCVERGLAPGGKAIESLLGLAARAGVFRMHVDTVGATVELGRTSLDQVEEPRLEARAPQVSLEPAQRPDPFGRDLAVADALIHRRSLHPL